MSRYVDIHAHVLYGIDDGPADRAAAELMLRTAAKSGTATIAATPHLRSDFPDVRVDELAGRVDELRGWIADEGLGIELISGGEVGLVWALDADDRALRLSSYGQLGRDLLIETPDTVVGLEALLYQVRTRGFRITLAHPERCRDFQRDPSTVEGLVERGVLLQINAEGLLGDPRRSPTARLAQRLCLDGLAHALASDSHRATNWRPVSVMPVAVAAAAELVGAERAEWLAVDSPAAIISGRPLPEAPPVVTQPRARWWSRA